MFIGGDIDTNQDNIRQRGATPGKSRYVVDLFTGSLIWSYSYAKNAPDDLLRSSDVAVSIQTTMA